MSHLSTPFTPFTRSTRSTRSTTPRLFSDAFRALRIGFLAGCLGGCAPPSPSVDEATGADDSADDADAISIPTAYVAIESALPPGSVGRWNDVRERLFEQFDEICGDTFCEGDWSNLEPLELACSATSKRGLVRECVWTFGASQEVVEAAGGTISASIPIFSCRFRPQGTAHQLLVALADDPLWAPLPGQEESIYDLIGDCFESPSGETPLADDTLDGPYVDVAEGIDDESIDAWYAMTGALRDAYAESVAGETGVPRALRLRCGMDQNTRKIRSCAWIFAEATPIRGSKGLHKVDEARHVCSFTADAEPGELARALGPTPVANVDPLDRALPGSDETLRDVLDACW